MTRLTLTRVLSSLSLNIFPNQIISLHQSNLASSLLRFPINYKISYFFIVWSTENKSVDAVYKGYSENFWGTSMNDVPFFRCCRQIYFTNNSINVRFRESNECFIPHKDEFRAVKHVFDSRKRIFVGLLMK